MPTAAIKSRSRVFPATKSPDWSPDGSRIAFVRVVNGGFSTELWTIRPDGTGLSQVTSAPPWPSTYDGAPDWAPDGSRIVYTRSYEADGEYCADILAIRPDGSGLSGVRGATCESGVFSNFYGDPGWSPDGTRVASGEARLFTVRVDGSDYVGLPGDAYTADWQPLPVNTPSTYVRPKGATPVYASFVTAFEPCSASNRTHAPPLGYPSCHPPVPASPNLAVSAGETRLRSVGFLRARVLPGAPANTDVQLTFSLTNVMKASDHTEYSGEVGVRIPTRVTDSEGPVSSTTQGFPLSWSVPCAPTPDPQVASACTLDTTLDAVLPGTAAGGTAAIWAFDAVQVHDGGPDGDAETEAGNSLFLKQGVFVP